MTRFFFYAALDDEVNLDLSIKVSLDYGKKAALPVCIDNNVKCNIIT